MEQQELLVKMVLDNWYSTVTRTDKLLAELTDEQIEGDAAPGRNSGKYLLGHLTAVNDRMLPLLGFGEALYPHFTDVFLASPDKSGKEMPPVSELRTYWKASCELLDNHFKNTTAGSWLGRHTSVSEEDFAKEPHRNKLNVVISRTNHLAGHLGQMLYLRGR